MAISLVTLASRARREKCNQVAEAQRSNPKRMSSSIGLSTRQRVTHDVMIRFSNFGRPSEVQRQGRALEEQREHGPLSCAVSRTDSVQLALPLWYFQSEIECYWIIAAFGKEPRLASESLESLKPRFMTVTCIAENASALSECR